MEYENIETLYEDLKKAFKTLQEVQEIIHNDYQLDVLERAYEIKCALKDSRIKRFQYTSALLFKYITRYQEEISGFPFELDIKPTIRNAVQVKLMSEDDGEALLDMLDCRNQTSHMYREEIAEDISNRIPGYTAVMKKIIMTLAPQKSI